MTRRALYRSQLREHPQAPIAIDYLKGRGITDEIAKEFELGFAPDGWDNLLKVLGGDEEGSPARSASRLRISIAASRW